MRTHYDWVIVTPISAFYKVNLYNELATNFKILVIVIAATSHQRQPDFYGMARQYEETVLWQGDLETRSKLATLRALRKVMATCSCDRLLVGGWDLPEFWWAVFASSANNVLALESSCYESQTSGIKAWIKRLFLTRIHTIIASGLAQQRLAQQLGFDKTIQLSHGVGLFYQGHRQIESTRTVNTPTRFLFVGRLAKEKNVSALLAVFSTLPHLQLTIVGDGPLASALHKESPPNVEWMGHVPNQKLAGLYQSHDVFILPSLSEPWGLVVEEALYYGLPLIVSNRVGCVEDLVLKPQTGLVFDVAEVKSLRQAILQMQDPKQYARFYRAATTFDFKQRDRAQVACYSFGV